MSTDTALRRALKEIIDPFKGLVKSPRALWGVNAAYFMEGVAYFGVLTILGKFLSENVGLSDLHAGWTYSLLTSGITLAMLLMGKVTDWVGVRKALLIALGILVAGRLLLALSGTLFSGGQGATSPMYYTVLLGILVVILGFGICQPAVYAGVKQFTDPKTATMAFALIYGLNNLGSFCSGVLSPPVRQHFGIQSVFWVYVVTTALTAVIVSWVMTARVVNRDTKTQISAQVKTAKVPFSARLKKVILQTLTFNFIIYLVLFLGFVGSGYKLFLLYRSSFLTEADQQLVRIDAQLEAVQKKMATPWNPDVSCYCAQTGSEIRQGAAQIQTTGAAELPAGATLEPAVFRMIASSWDKEGAWLTTLPPHLTEPGENRILPPDVTRTLRDEARALGVGLIAAAYATVDHVDASVIRKLRIRYKEPGESIIPMEEATQSGWVATLQKPLLESTASMAGALEAFAARVEAQPGGSGQVLATLIRIDAADLRQAATMLSAGRPGVARTYIKDLLIRSALFLLQPAATWFSSEKCSDSALVTARVKADREAIKSMRDGVADAVHVPIGAAFLRLAERYGLWALVAVTCFVLFIRRLLQHNPDHPFNNGRFVFFIFILIPVQTLFAHTWLTIPYYINRAFGGTWVGDNFEFFANLSPVLIFILTPLAAALTARYPIYRMMIWGTLIMGGSPFLLALAPNPALLMAYILLVSIGEAMWQPRFLQWVAEIAPEGKTGVYMGIGQFPWFMTKMITGLYSGYFLSRYCPLVGPQNTQVMWLIYGVIAIISPVMLWLLRGWAAKEREKPAAAPAAG